MRPTYIQNIAPTYVYQIMLQMPRVLARDQFLFSTDAERAVFGEQAKQTRRTRTTLEPKHNRRLGRIHFSREKPKE